MILDFTHEALAVYYNELPRLLVFHTCDHPENEGVVYRTNNAHWIAPPTAVQNIGRHINIHEHVIRRPWLDVNEETEFQVLSAYRIGDEEEDRVVPPGSDARWDRATWMVRVFEVGPLRWEVAIDQSFDYRDDHLYTNRLPVVLMLQGFDPTCRDFGRIEAMSRGDLPVEVRVAAWQHLLEDRPCLNE